jgi:hypothetical protein
MIFPSAFDAFMPLFFATLLFAQTKADNPFYVEEAADNCALLLWAILRSSLASTTRLMRDMYSIQSLFDF